VTVFVLHSAIVTTCPINPAWLERRFRGHCKRVGTEWLHKDHVHETCSMLW